MFATTVRIAAAWALLLFLIPAQTATAAEPSRATAMLRMLGFDTAIRSFVEEVKRAQTGFESDDAGYEAARVAIAERIFRPDSLFAEVAARVDDKFDTAEYDAFEAYFSQGVGRRVTEAEEYAQAPENEAERAAETPAIVEDLLTSNPGRLRQIAQMIDALDIVSSGTAMAMNLGFAMISGMASSGQLPGVLNDDQILMMLNNRRDQIEAEVFNAAVMSAAFTYRDISDDDMDDYLAFLESDLGHKLYRVLDDAQASVLTAASRQYGHDLMALSGMREL